MGRTMAKDESESWLIFERPVEVPDPGKGCARHVPVEIGFRLEKNEKEQRTRLQEVKESPLVVFFPTEKETRFGFSDPRALQDYSCARQHSKGRRLERDTGKRDRLPHR